MPFPAGHRFGRQHRVEHRFFGCFGGGTENLVNLPFIQLADSLNRSMVI